jgi:glutamyl-tRNA synthetase
VGGATPTGRLAPTPSGHLHLGNALAFGAAWLSARSQGGRLLLRLEDLDRGRARPDIAEAQRADLRWLGLDWDDEVAAQSTRTYPLTGVPTFRCPCTRQSRQYLVCMCRSKEHDRGAWRFNTPRAEVRFVDRAAGPQCFRPEDDPVLMRADGEAAYPLAVVLDDHRDGVTEVVRGGDLLPATATQLCLYGALNLDPPTWLHVAVLLGPDGRKLSKSHGSTELRTLRAAGWTPARVWRALGPLLGVTGLNPGEFVAGRVRQGAFTVTAAGALKGVAG